MDPPPPPSPLSGKHKKKEKRDEEGHAREKREHWSESFSPEEKQAIARQIQDISVETVDREMAALQTIGRDAHLQSSRCRTGNSIVDRFTFLARLETRGKYNVNFFEFVANIDAFRQKRFIQTMLQYYADVKNRTGCMNEYRVLKEVYNVCISAINIMRPLVCMDVYARVRARRVLNFCAGWGGTAVAAAALNLEAYVGIELNTDLRAPHEALLAYLRARSSTDLRIVSGDATQFDYASIEYDTVFTSPPYYFIQKYNNNATYACKRDMDDQFYRPVFARTYAHLAPGGSYVINVCAEVYDRVLVPLLGAAHDRFSLKKMQRQNAYQEIAYLWNKPAAGDAMEAAANAIEAADTRH